MTSPREERERELAAPRVGRVPADTLSNRLMLARKLAGLSIRDAADLCGYGRGAWTNWERGARPLDLLDITGVIAEKLDIDINWLRFGGPLVPAQGRSTRRSESDTVRYPLPDLDVPLGYGPYPIPTDRPMTSMGHPANLRPKSREDRTRPMSPNVAGRRAALVR